MAGKKMSLKFPNMISVPDEGTPAACTLWDYSVTSDYDLALVSFDPPTFDSDDPQYFSAEFGDENDEAMIKPYTFTLDCTECDQAGKRISLTLNATSPQDPTKSFAWDFEALVFQVLQVQM